MNFDDINETLNEILLLLKKQDNIDNRKNKILRIKSRHNLDFLIDNIKQKRILVLKDINYKFID